MTDKIVLLNGDGKLWIDSVRHQAAVIISPIGEITLSVTNLRTGLQTSILTLDAVAAYDLNQAQNAFYRGEFEGEMNETP